MNSQDIAPMFSLDGKVALITGASKGIGEEIARIFSLAGARVVICSRKQGGINEAAERIRQYGGQILPVVSNVSIAEDRENVVKAAMDWGGQIDILVNNVGANPSYGALADLSEEAWDKVFAVNLKASFFLAQLVYHAWMREQGGTILNVSSVGGFECHTGLNAYNVAKAALNHLTRCLASEWGHNGIRVNALAPGLIKTRFSQALWEDPRHTEVIKGNPIPRVGEVSDLSGAALLLVSNASSYITGHTLVADGGRML